MFKELKTEKQVEEWDEFLGKELREFFEEGEEIHTPFSDLEVAILRKLDEVREDFRKINAFQNVYSLLFLGTRARPSVAFGIARAIHQIPRRY